MKLNSAQKKAIADAMWAVHDDIVRAEEELRRATKESEIVELRTYIESNRKKLSELNEGF